MRPEAVIADAKEDEDDRLRTTLNPRSSSEPSLIFFVRFKHDEGSVFATEDEIEGREDDTIES